MEQMTFAQYTQRLDDMLWTIANREESEAADLPDRPGEP